MKIYGCEYCKNLFLTLTDGHVVPMCCHKDMFELQFGSTDGATEKHAPAISQDGDAVVVPVGEIEHPMLPEHYVEWIVVEADDQAFIQYLKPGDKPVAEFKIPAKVKKLVAYEYCNLHGAWKAKKS